MAAGEGTLESPLIEPGAIEARPYQTELVEKARDAHTLVSLPTGLGKTAVSLRVTAHRLADRPDGKAMLLAPTKPLVEQHAAFYREALTIPDEQIVVFTGETAPEDRGALFSDARIIVGTPQVIENDLLGNRIDLEPVVHLTFDECHRASGDYPYAYVAERYHESAADPLVTGMSASPGDDEEAIEQVMANLGLERVAVKTESDPDVAEYTHETDVEWVRVELPEAVIEIRDLLQEVLADRLGTLRELGVTGKTDPEISQGDLHEIRKKLQRRIDDGDSAGYEGMSVHAEIMKVKRAVELVETQSVDALRRYFERQRNAARSSGASKASQRFVSDPQIKRAMSKAEAFEDLHPKFRRVRILLAETLGVRDGDRVIVFTESRDTAEALTEFLSAHFSVRRFVGQGDKEGSSGMTQTEQTEVLEAFRAGEFEVLVSTSVAEEGLDVPEVDLVCFFEPVPNAIRSIQRKGRTGRQARGRVVVLLAEDTRDEAYFWISRRREDEMAAELEGLREAAPELEAEFDDEQAGLETFAGEDGPTDTSEEREADTGDGQAGIADFGAAETNEDGATEAPPGEVSADDSGVVAEAGGEDHVEIVIDQRELDASIARDLSKREGIETRLETLEVGDYVLSDRVAVERKTIEDFLSTLLDGDRGLFDQIGDLTRHYGRPVLVIEGEGDLYGERNVHPNAIRGALASLAVDFGVSVLFTPDETETAALLETIARREQETRDREVSVHGTSAAKTLAEQQEYVVASIADIGPITARSLLEALGSVEAVLTADEATLQSVEGVGEVTASRIREVVGSEYES
ncbi:Hef nuclease [Halodesulfurarchaeum formicicum]|uniref:Hef nuclease n=1 Tax=Halodesulfurarchaeum formicicum TaxID=1873524 RepID=A0A1D8S1P6_9EURY|nr:DEAD/DEAH box helicase [Halodesulfurarchaeum formicicum]AOW79251.1 Hef nuclease [Halodesulfurarchaeum formicicum]